MYTCSPDLSPVNCSRDGGGGGGEEVLYTHLQWSWEKMWQDHTSIWFSHLMDAIDAKNLKSIDNSKM